MIFEHENQHLLPLKGEEFLVKEFLGNQQDLEEQKHIYEEFMKQEGERQHNADLSRNDDNIEDEDLKSLI